MSYWKRWRKRHADLRELLEESSSEEDIFTNVSVNDFQPEADGDFENVQGTAQESGDKTLSLNGSKNSEFSENESVSSRGVPSPSQTSVEGESADGDFENVQDNGQESGDSSFSVNGSENPEYSESESASSTGVVSPLQTSVENESEDHGFDSEQSESVNQFGDVQLYSSTESDSDTESNDRPDVAKELVTWAVRNRETRNSINEILAIFRRQGLEHLPKDARTLLKTPRLIEEEAKCGGKYFHFGLKSGILETFKLQAFPDTLTSIDLHINVDGLPIFKNSEDCFWPILCSFHGCKPFIVSLFCGKHKPTSLDDYLEDFLNEYIVLKDSGIEINVRHYDVSIHAFICDAPARSFLKCTQGHTGYFACERCTIRGTWNGRVTYDTEAEFPLRTDEKFDNLEYGEHQKRLSPLVICGSSLINDFSLDYMHLVCLGVVKKVLTYLKKGPPCCKLSKAQTSELSEILLSFQGKLPSDFARQPRSLKVLDRWKATEFRQFLLYTGPVALKGILHKKAYIHFMTLSVALSILLNCDEEKRNAYVHYAGELLQHFVKNCCSIFGRTFNVYNVHNLLHLADDVKHFQCSLNEVSAFPFETYLHQVKKAVKSPLNPVAQVAKRKAEAAQSDLDLHRPQAKKYTSKTKDRCYSLSNGSFAIIQDVRKNGYCLCDIIHQSEAQSFFTSPCNSKLLDIVYVANLTGRRKRVIDPASFERKVVCLPYKTGHVLLPLLHASENS